MTPEEKELLLKALCALIPYGVIVRGIFINYSTDKGKILYEECDKQLNYQDLSRYESLKPYLRPMSSMTAEEYKEYTSFECVTIYEDGKIVSNGGGDDWLNEHHFDYRELIPMGLAFEAPEDMYNIE